MLLLRTLPPIIGAAESLGTIGHVGCDIHYSHDGHYGFVSHDCHEAIKVIIDLRPSRLKKRKMK